MIVITLSLLGLALLPASQLRIETELTALLPESEPAAVEYRRFLDLFGGFERVFVLIVARETDAPEEPAEEALGEDPEEDSDPQLDPQEKVLTAAEILAPLVAELPEVAKVRAGLEDQDQDFFLRHVVRRSPLLIPDRDLEVLESLLEPAALENRAKQLRSQVHSPAGRFELQFAVQDPLGLSSRLPVLGEAGGGLPVDPWTGAFLSPDGEVALLVVTPALGEMDAEGGRRLDEGLRLAFERCRAELGDQARGLDFAAVGGPLYAAQDEHQIRTDLQGTILGSALACSLILFFAFGGLTIPAITMSVLGVALVWTAAVLSLTVGSVTGAGLGFAAVLVGLGVDYGIHGGTRFRSLRLRGFGAVEALEDTFRHAGPAIATSALSTACAFAALAAADFRPLREIGTVVSVGILAILLAVATLGAAWISWTGGAGSQGNGGRLWRSLGSLTEFSVAMACRFPRWTLLAAGAMTAICVPGLLDLEVDPDLRKLRPADHPALEVEALLVQKFGVGASTLTVVVPGEDRDQTLDRAAQIAAYLRQIEGGELSIVSPSDLLISSGSSEQRLRRLADLPLTEAADTLEASLRAVNLNPRSFAPGLEALRSFGAGRDVEAAGSDELPESLDELLTVDAQGRTWAALRIRLGRESWPSGPPDEVLQELRRISPEVAVASVPRLGSAMKSLARHDFLKLSWIAALLVFGVVMISFRGRVVACLLAVTPVVVGCVWTLGVWGRLGLSLDLLSLSVVPILIGIGIDDGLHAVHGTGSRIRSVSGLAESVRQSGLAMALTTLTTCVGFGSLATSSIPGLRNGGLLVAVGVLLCLLATLWILPAVGALLRTGDGSQKLSRKDELKR